MCAPPRPRGCARRRSWCRHVLRNAMIPTVTVIGLQAGYLLGGSVVVERLFAWPGIGDLLLTGDRRARLHAGAGRSRCSSSSASW